MSKLQKIARTFLIIALIMFFIISLNYNVNANEDVYLETTTAKNGDVVYFQKPDSWGDSTPYIYAWDSYSNPQNYLGGSFPGIAMTLVSDNLYKYEFDSDIKYVKLIFSDGSSTNQTEDLDYICNGYIYQFDNTTNLTFSEKTLYLGDTIYFEKPDSWDSNVFIYMWNTNNNNNSNSNWASTYMNNVSGNLYSYTLSDSDWNIETGFNMVIFGDGTRQTKDLSTVDSNLIFKANSDPLTEGDNANKYDGIWVYSHEQLGNLLTLIQNTTVPTDDIPYYTEDSYKIYDEQFNLANTVADSKYVAASYFDLTSQYNKSLIALQFAYDNLKLNTKLLSDKIAEMENVDTSKYEQSLVNAFNTSIQEAKTVLNSDNITLESMKKAISNMETAYSNLKVDKTDLEAIINKAKEIDTTLYTDETSKILIDAISEATEVYEDNDASYLDVEEQITKLNDAITNLVLKEVEKEDNTTENQNNTAVEENNAKSNPSTGDTILKLVGILAVATIVCIGTTIYLKKNKNKE